MKPTGTIRQVDTLGRIVLPIEFRRALDIEEKDKLEITMENDRIILQKFEQSCVFCASLSGLRYFKGKYICESCWGRLKED